MKLIQTERDALLDPLQAVTGIVERRHTLPILSNVLLSQADGRLTLLATDLEIQVVTRCDLGRARDAGLAVTVSARKLLDILRSLPADAEVDVQVSDNRMQVKAHRGRYNLQTLPATDFPRLPPFDAQAIALSVPQKDLRHLLTLVQYAMAQQDIRYYLNGLLLEISGSELRAVATDGHRLAYASLALPPEFALPPEHEKRELIVPRKAVLELIRQLGATDDAVNIEIGQAQVRFRFGDIELTSKLIDGKFPEYQRVIPTHYQDRFQIDRQTLLQSLQRAAILSNEKFRGVRWVLTADCLRVLCTNSEQEEAQEELEIQYSGAALEVSFNVTYVLDVLNNLDCASIECAFGDVSASALLTDPGNASFRYVVMPMRI